LPAGAQVEIAFTGKFQISPHIARRPQFGNMIHAEKWAKSAAVFERLFSFLQSVVSIKRDAVVAEFGIGKWGFGHFYAEKFSKVYGIDVEDYSRYHPGIEFLISDGDTIPLPDQSVDLVVSHSVLEHVHDLSRSLTEINRIVTVDGHLFLTVSPLYYSSFGAHLYKDGKRLDDWEHLDPLAPYFLTDNPLPNAATSGHSLNKLTSSRFLSCVGEQPWLILRYEISLDPREIPSYVGRSVASPLDLRAREFRFVGRKLLLKQ
jgi:SAM-dependent methyltransferase